MKTIVAGSREGATYQLVASELNRHLDFITSVVSGGARGVDSFGEQWARENEKHCYLFPADWDKHGKAAGMFRNKEMAKFADQLIAFWDGKSKGTKNMIEEMRKLRKPVTVVILPCTPQSNS